jgi:uncharacterized repeat protein (TIGR03803 family)
MQNTGVRAWLGRILAVASLSTILAAGAWAEGTESVLYPFTFHTDGGMPYAGLTFDAKGNLYGTTYFAGFIPGSICCGVVFQLTPNGGEGWTYKVIHTFTGPVTDGEAPSASVIFDAAGNLYGTTQEGGFCGVAYELSPTPDGEWNETILHLFNNLENGVIDDGCIPSSWLVFDKAGNLYGTTQQTGAGDCMTSAGCGTVFELSPLPDGKWTEHIIHRFPREGTGDGISPYGGLVFDSAGNLWGTTTVGGAASSGTVFEMTPKAGGGWDEHVAFSFSGDSTGWYPYAGLTIDPAGNLYGTAYYGGLSDGGVVFKMTPQAGGLLSETVIHKFAACNAAECPDGIEPYGGVAFDSAGDLYGTTEYGGAAGTVCDTPPPVVRYGCGVVYKLAPGLNGAWDYSLVYHFPGGPEGAFLQDDRLTVDNSGNIFGTTFVEGDVNNDEICPQAVLGLGGCGVVFEITP